MRARQLETQSSLYTAEKDKLQVISEADISYGCRPQVAVHGKEAVVYKDQSNLVD